MAGQQRQFNPGVSLAGAVDLEALKHQVTAEPGQAGGAPAAGGYVIDTTENTFQAMVQTSATFPILLLEALKHQVTAEPGQAGGAPAAGGYVIDTTENTFQAMVQTSATFPILLLLWLPTDDRLFPMAKALGDAVNAMNGQLQLSRIDVASFPAVAQAFGVQGAPALFALINGRPMPLLQGVPSDQEMQQIVDEVLPKIVQVAQQAGVTGTAPYAGDPDAGQAPSLEQTVPPEHEQAHRLAMEGDYAGAAAAYSTVLEADPNDALAARERAKALLLARSADADVREVRAAAADHPEDVDAQMAVADIDMIGDGRGRYRYDRRADPGCVRSTAGLSGGRAPGSDGDGARASAGILRHPRPVRRTPQACPSPSGHAHVLIHPGCVRSTAGLSGGRAPGSDGDGARASAGILRHPRPVRRTPQACPSPSGHAHVLIHPLTDFRPFGRVVSGRRAANWDGAFRVLFSGE